MFGFCFEFFFPGLFAYESFAQVIALKDVFISASRDVYVYQQSVVNLLGVRLTAPRYIVTELLGADLHQVITSQKLDDQYIRYFLYQILRGLKVSVMSVVYCAIQGSDYL